MKKTNRKGFTIVELVIVIAVIAILAGVLIPTFASVVKKANISSDTQLCKNMNTALAMAKAEGATPDTMEEVLFVINEAGYVIENLNPTTEGYYFAWDSKNGQIVFLNEDLDVHYPADAEINPADCWITVGSQEEANTVAAESFNLYLEPQFAESDLELTTLVGVDAGVNTLNSLKITSDATGSIAVRGQYAAVTLDVKNADVDQTGVITDLDVVAVKVGTLKINGYVENISVTAGKVVVNNTGIVKTIEAGAELFDGANSTGLILDTDAAVDGYTAPEAVTIASKTDLMAFRDTVNGGYNYAGTTVTLTADIDLAGVAWLPIGNFARSKTANIGFAGTFDGGNHTIKNLSNEGFSVAGLTFGSNDSTPFGRSEAVYGLFGCVYNAEIKNLTVNANIKMADDGTFVGDSVAAIVGYAYGDFIKIDNCTVNGDIVGFDAVGGFVGRAYTTTASITNCTGNANVTADQNNVALAKGYAAKAGGLLGYISQKKDAVDITDSTCTGTVKLANIPTGNSTKLFSNTFIYTDGGAKPNN